MVVETKQGRGESKKKMVISHRSEIFRQQKIAKGMLARPYLEIFQQLTSGKLLGGGVKRYRAAQASKRHSFARAPIFKIVCQPSEFEPMLC